MISYVDPLLFSIIFFHHLLVYFSFERSSKPYERKPKSTRESVDLWMPASRRQSLDDRAHMHKSKGKMLEDSVFPHMVWNSLFGNRIKILDESLSLRHNIKLNCSSKDSLACEIQKISFPFFLSFFLFFFLEYNFSGLMISEKANKGDLGGPPHSVTVGPF